MADERSPVGGSSAPILRRLEALDSEIKGLRADVGRLRESGQTTRRAAGGAREEARGATRGGTGAVEEETRSIDRQSVARQRSARIAAAQRAALQEQEAAVAQVNQVYGGGAATLERYKTATSAVTQETATSSQAFRKHGALTTEFLTAAARGDATLGEFRYQIGATIAKFAGWTAASAAVFGVLGALRELGKGALDSLDSVNLLTRVITHVDRDKAAAGIGGLAEQFNLPIEDVGAAVFQFAKVPENDTVPKALKASEAALFAVKVGELDAADAGRLLISIQQGLGESSTELTGRFDQVNQAQNKFGVNIRDTLAGLAKSTGAFRAAGGTFDQALAIITTASRVSGRSGEQIGTALQRSAGLVRRPINQQQLREFGIDPDQGIGRIYTQAIDRARGLGGRQRLRLATALSTPQLAPYLVGVLNHPDLYQQVLKQTSPQQSKGSAQRELSRQLKSASEQLQKVLIEVQVLGEELARVGAFDAFGLMVKSLNQALSVLNGILKLVNDLPEPIRKAGVYALEFYAALRLARRFNVGQSLVGTRAEGLAGFLQQGPIQRGRRQVIRGLHNDLDAFRNERERVTANLSGKSLEREIAVRQTQAALAEQAALPAGASATTRAAANRKVLNAARDAERIEAEIQTASTRQLYIKERINETEKRVGLAGKIRNTDALREFAAQPLPPTGNVPNTGAVRTVEQEYGVGGGVIPGGGGGGAGEGEDERVARNRAQALKVAQREQRYAASVARYEAALGLLGRGPGGHALTGGLARAEGAIDDVAESAKNLPEKASKFGGKLAGLGASIGDIIGPFEALIIDYFIVSAAMDRVSAQGDRLNQQATFIPHSTRQARTQGASLHARLKSLQDANKANAGGLLGALNPFNLLTNAGDYFDTAENALSGVDPQAQTRTDIDTVRRTIAAQRKNPITSGKFNAQLTADTISRQLDDAKRARGAGTLTLREYDRALSTALDDVRGGVQINRKDKAALLAKTREARSGIAPLRELSEAQLRENIASYTNIAGSAGQSGRAQSQALKTAQGNLAELARRIDQRGATPKDLADLAAQEDSVVKAITERAQSEVQSGLLYARSDAQRQSVYARAIQRLRRDPVRNQNRTIAGLERRSTQDHLSEEGLRALRHTVAERGAGLQDIPGVGDRIRAQLRSLDKQIGQAEIKGKQDQADLKEARSLRTRLRRAVRDEIKQLADQRFDEGQASGDLEAQIAAAKAGPDQVRTTTILLKRAGEKVTALIRRYGRQNDKTRQAILEQVNLQQQLAQAQSDHIGAVYDVRIAQTQDPLQRANLSVQKAKAILGRAKGDQRLAALQQYYQALQEADQARLDIANAEFELQKSLTADPIKQAAIQVKQDQYNLAHSKSQADRLRNQAQLNNDKRAYKNARQQEAFDHIEYLADINNIDRDVELQRLKDLLKTIHGNKQLRQEIKRRIAALQGDLTDFDLDVGSIKLPTAYQIRRALIGGLSPQMSVTNSPNVNVTVNDPNAAYKVGEVLDNTLGTSTRAAMRAAGYRGG